MAIDVKISNTKATNRILSNNSIRKDLAIIIKSILSQVKGRNFLLKRSKKKKVYLRKTFSPCLI